MPPDTAPLPDPPPPPAPQAGPAPARAEPPRPSLSDRSVAVPLVLALLLVGAVAGMVVYSHQANRRDALRLADFTLALLEARIGTEVTAFLSVPERALAFLAAFAGHRALVPEEHPAAIESATAVMQIAPSIALVGFADADGNFLMVRRPPEGSGFEVRTIQFRDGVRTVTWDRPGPDGTRVVTDDPNDRFDPRTRPWWHAAHRGTEVGWTDLYIFATDRQPGVSAARLMPEGRVEGVLMADIRLASLSNFLSTLAIGNTGRALIVDRDGRLVGMGDPRRRIEIVGEQLTPVRLDQLQDPVLSRAFDLFRAEGPGRRSIEVGNARYIALASQLPGQGRDWNLLMVVPEDDLVGFVGRNTLVTVAIAAGVILLALLLAAQVVRQHARGLRAAARAAGRAEALRGEAEAYARLSAAAGPADILAAVGQVLGARRAGLWRLDPGADALACEALHEVAAGTTAAGVHLRSTQVPRFLAAVAAGGTIAVRDAASDGRTGDLARLYLRPAGTRGLLALPLRTGAAGDVAGVLMVEEPARTGSEAVRFADAAGAMLARGMAPAAAATPKVAATTPGRDRARELMLRIADDGGAPTRLAIEGFPRLAVLLLRLDEDAVLNAAAGASARLLDRIAQALAAAATASGVPCLRALGDRVLIADGFGGDAEDAVRRLADLALALQERLAEAFTEAELGLDFRLGLDLGPAAGTRARLVGGDAGAPDEWNIFGEAVRAAELLADSAPPGGIQVSESAHAALASGFVLRARGRFFLPQSGELGTWLMAGHA